MWWLCLLGALYVLDKAEYSVFLIRYDTILYLNCEVIKKIQFGNISEFISYNKLLCDTGIHIKTINWILTKISLRIIIKNQNSSKQCDFKAPNETIV